MKKEEIVQEANRCLNCKMPKCKEACPLHNDVPTMISKLKEGKLQEAYEIDLQTNPLGAICGLVCPHDNYCEGACVRGIKETPVKIGAIENYICEEALKMLGSTKPSPVPDAQANHLSSIVSNAQATTYSTSPSTTTSHPEVAIIGGGPARNSLCVLSFKK